jgi:hypothetical protein
VVGLASDERPGYGMAGGIGLAIHYLVTMKRVSVSFFVIEV